MKLVLVVLKIEHVGSAPHAAVTLGAVATSSSTENADKGNGSESQGDKEKVDSGSGISYPEVSLGD